MSDSSSRSFKKAMALIESPEARVLSDPAASSSDLKTAALAYIERAKNMGISSELWYIKGPFSFQSRGQHRYPGALWTLLINGSAKSISAAQALIDAGGSVEQSYASYGGRGPGLVEYEGSTNSVVVEQGFWGAGSKRARHLFFKNALESAAKRPNGNLAQDALDAYQASLKGSSKSAKTAMGPGDKSALDACETLRAIEPELLALCSTEELMKAALSALGDAREREMIKSGASEAERELSPEKLKKSTSKEKKSRMKSLIDIISKHGHDEDLVNAALGASGWLKETPALACLAIAGEQSVFGAALENGRVGALKTLISLGANIWLAAAQAGALNACDWAMEKVAVNEALAQEADLTFLASALMKGAWLDGAEDPKTRCLELAKKGFERVQSEYGSDEGTYREGMRLLSCLERLSLEESLGPVAPARNKSSSSRGLTL